MKRLLVALLVVVVAFGGLMLAIGLYLRSTIHGAEKDRLVASLGQKMGVAVSVATVDLDLSQWFRFRPAVALGGVEIGNPPGFRAKDLLQAKSISARVSLAPLFHKQVEVQSIVVDEPQIVVESNSAGATNVEALLKRMASSHASGGEASGSGSASNVSVAEFSVTSGTLTYSAGENISLHDINLLVQGFSTDHPCHIEISAKYVSGGVSGFKLSGQAGPFTPDSLPLDATLSLTIAPSEIPGNVRRDQFGVMLATPGDKSRVNLDASIKGDGYRAFSGPAKLTLSKILIGGHQDHLLALSGEAPSNFTGTGFLLSRRFTLDLPKASLQLGKGSWTGSGDFRLNGGTISGTTRGAIRDIDINEFLSSFTSSSGKVYGLLAMPSSSLEFAGHDAAEMLNSLKGSAKIAVTQGRIASMDLPATLERVLGNNESASATKGNTQFTTLSADVNIAERKMNISDLTLDSPVLRITGAGVIDFDENLNFALVAHIAGGKLGQLISTGPLHMPNVNAHIPLTVTGTVEAPQVHPQIGKMAKAAVHEAVKGIIGGFLKKKLAPQQ